jgi:hypothetical protein
MNKESKNLLVSTDEKVTMEIPDVPLLHFVPVLANHSETHLNEAPFFFDRNSAQNLKELLDRITGEETLELDDYNTIIFRKTDDSVHVTLKTTVYRDVEADFDISKLREFADQVTQLASKLS